MQHIVSSLLCLVALCLFVDAQQEQVANQQRTCSGGYKEGDQVDRGRYWYLCQDGQLVPKGCFSDDRKRMNLQESFVTGSYVLSCIIDPNGYLSFAYKGCVFDNKQYAIGDTWDDGKYWFSCSKDGEALRMEVSGCVYESKRYNIGDTLERDQFLYECRRWANNTCSMCPVGCLADGKRYRVGESFEQGQFWYSCTIEDGRVTKKCVGCMHASQRLQDGDRYFQEDAIFECDIRKGVDPVHRIVGCVDQNGGNRIERRVGCQWTHGQAPLQYVMRCEASADEKSIKKETVYCYYAIGNEGGYQIDPGCFKIYDTLILACRKTDAGVLLETFPMTQLDQTYTKGVRMC